MALNIIKSLNSSVNSTSIIVNNQSFVQGVRFAYQSITGQLHAKLVKRWKLVAEHVDLSEEECRRIVLKTKGVQSMSESALKRMAAVFKEIQIPSKTLVECPKIFGYYPVQIEQRYLCLKELGLHPLSIPEILRCPTIMKRNAFDLKSMRLLPADVDPLDHLLSQLPSLDISFLEKHPNIRNMPLLYIRRVVLLELLSQKLGFKKREILQLMETYPVLRNRSIYSHLATIELLVDTLNISTSRLKSSGFLLTIQPNNFEKVLASFPEVTRQSLVNFIQGHPRLLFQPADQILKSIEYLRQSGITDEQMTNCWAIFFLPTATVQECLNKLTSAPSDITLQQPTILSYVYYLGRTKQKLQSHVVSPGLSDLKICNVKDVCTRKGNILYLAQHFNRNTDWIREQLARHPRLSLDETHNCRNTVDCLIGKGFSKLQIENALHLVLYSIDTINANLDMLSQHKDIEEFGNWKAHPYILQFLLYEIEKSVSSSGKCDEGAQKVPFLKTNEHDIPQMTDCKQEENAVCNPEDERYGKDAFWD